MKPPHLRPVRPTRLPRVKPRFLMVRAVNVSLGWNHHKNLSL
ncbi:hypothetical protein NWP17_06945 [Chrysosporum bergii ANA360D]|uniref:Uncharacterized protein n=1 Tax=Chrysosporum bergii ANA360D TaxID=617107 RepID=A0AA43GRD9_9CYAN|nr:hypothetical protein [Chrysosporum bergii]MDH6060174.1 hypothetical protein [Chrysosporum bergii ANA360D]